MQENVSLHIRSIGQMHRLLNVEKPRHPLLSILQFEDIPPVIIEQRTRLITDFYQITLKIEQPCKIQYGQSPFDFDDGVISCFAPKQIAILDPDFQFASSGWLLLIHPDFLRLHPLRESIKNYSFFEYEVNEALLLSDEEQRGIEGLFRQIQKEYVLPIDNFSRDVIIGYIDLLLTYCNRYYNRQFITRKVSGHELLGRFHRLLGEQLDRAAASGLPTVTQLAAQLNLSPKYLSDCLKQITGQTTQQLIHDYLIEQAKDMLAASEFTVSEIAFKLGFEQAQSFSKLFKSKTNITPLKFRSSFV